MTIRRMTLGSGYRYLMHSVVQSDGASQQVSALTRYYAESGTPPGRLLGSGLAGLGDGYGIPEGTRVSEEHLFRMLGMLQDPLTGAQLGSAPPSTRTEAAAGRRHQTVAGFDLTFSVPKSVSVAWALAGPATQAAVYEAHQQALAYVIRYAETNVFSSRSGQGGVVQEDIRGVVAAAFDHWDSRTGDPQLHTHLVVMNRVQTRDGVWRTLDSRGMFKAAVGLSEMYNGVLSDYLTTALGWGWEPAARRHSSVPKYEVAGVGEALREEFSTRTAAIEDAVAALVPAFTAAHGRAPSSREVLQLRQQATLATRPDKQVRPLAELVEAWRGRAVPFVGGEPVAWVAGLADRNDLPLLGSADLSGEMLADLAAVAVHTVAEKRATFSRSNVFAEVQRQLHGVRFTHPDERMRVVERTVEAGLAQALLISPPDLAHTPARFTRPDGTSRFRARGMETYTTQDLLDAEARLLDAGRDTTGPRATPTAASNVNAPEVDRLAPDQTAAIDQVATSGRVLDVLVGPAGTGKSTTMGGLRALWQHSYGTGSVIGLAPSAAAAQVLTDEFGAACENTCKWLTEHVQEPARLAEFDRLRERLARSSPSLSTRRLRERVADLAAQIQRWRLHEGQLVVVDEASLAGTFALDTLTEQAGQAGAKIVLVGDWAQLSPVEAGGAFHLLVRDRDHPPELHEARRFTAGWEKHASIGLRTGQPDVIDRYDAHGRIHGGDRDAMLDQLYTAWRADLAAGRSSLMVAADAATVAELNARARTERVALGQVSRHGVHTHDGVTIGVGDRVVTRRNDRRLPTGNGWVKNGDQWTVTNVTPGGDLTVTRTTGSGGAGRGQVGLPAAYAREHVELGYATTAHRAQGRTVQTAHTFVSATSGREVLYVAATRGREANTLYVDTRYDPDPDTAHAPAAEQTAAQVLRQVLATPVADTSATDTIATTWNEQHHIGRIWAEYATIAAAAHHDRYDALVAASGLSPDRLAQARKSTAYDLLLADLRHAEARGLDVSRAFPRLVTGRTLEGADDVAAVLHSRVERWTKAADPRGATSEPRIVGIFPAAVHVDEPDLRRGLDQRAALIEDRAHQLAALAVEHGQAWAAQLGRPPMNPIRREQWLAQLETVGAYRERWGITGRDILGRHEPVSTEQEDQRWLAQRAIEAALQIHRSASATAGGLGRLVQMSRGVEGPQL